MTPDRLLRWLLSFPFPGAVAAMQSGDLVITLEGEVLRFDGAWRAPDGQRIPCTLDDAPTPDDLHAEIRRGLAIARGITGASWERIEADCAEPDLPDADPYIPTLAEIADEPPLEDALHDRLTDEIDRRRDVEAQFAKVTAERDQARQAYLDLGTNNPLRPTVNAIAERLGVCPAEPGPMLTEVDRLKDLADAHAVVSQRLIGSQKEVATLTAQHDDWQADIDRARRDADEATARAEKLEDRLRRDDELREQIAVAVGLDGSASLALILDTVTRDRPVREISRLSGLLDVLAAPVSFGERRLSTAERAEWAPRR